MQNPTVSPMFDPNALKQAAAFKQGAMVVRNLTAELVQTYMMDTCVKIPLPEGFKNAVDQACITVMIILKPSPATRCKDLGNPR